MNTTGLVVEIRPEKNSGPYGIWTHNLCDIGAEWNKFHSRLPLSVESGDARRKIGGWTPNQTESDEIHSL